MSIYTRTSSLSEWEHSKSANMKKLPLYSDPRSSTGELVFCKDTSALREDREFVLTLVYLNQRSLLTLKVLVATIDAQ